MTDYAIARRIVDLHSRNEESVDRMYSVEDITRYIMFARQFKPKVYHKYLGLDVRKPVFGVSDKARLKPVSSATETR